MTASWHPLLSTVATVVPPDRRTVVVVPHPDDEVLSTSALIHVQTALGRPVTVVAVTDGEAAYDTEGLGPLRVAEQSAALADLGVTPGSTHRLGLPDGQVADHHAELVAGLAPLVDADTLIAAPWVHDHHCDHEAVGRAAAEIARQTGAVLLQGLFWAWHHRQPAELGREPLVAIAVDDELRQLRQRAIAQHASQVTTAVNATPMLDGEDLVPLSWPLEFYVDSERRLL